MGDGGLVLTVPKAWCDYYTLKAGDVVIVIADGELRIQPAEKRLHGKEKSKRRTH